MKIMMLLADAQFPRPREGSEYYDVRVRKEARTLIKAGHELSLLSRWVSGKPAEEVIEGIKVIRAELPPQKIIIKRAWDQLHFAFNFIDNFWQKALAKAVEHEKPQALHIHDLPMVETGLSVARDFNIPLVADLHENYPEGIRVWRRGWKGKASNLISPKWRWKQMERRCLSRVDRVVVVVDESKDHYVKDCSVSPGKITVVMNVEDDYFCSLPVNEEIVKRYAPYFTVSYIGKFGVHRGVHTAIAAMPYVLNEIANARLMLIGSGSNEAELKKMAKDIGVAEAVEFTGHRPFDLVPSYIAASHVCLVPHIASGHTNTTIPHKLFQYMTMAKPVIVSSAKPLARIVTETGAGLVYPSGDASSLAKAIIQIYKDKEFAADLGEAGRAAVEKQYNWQREEKKLISLYQQDLRGII